MKAAILTRASAGATPRPMKWARSLAAAPVLAALSGCVQVAAPEKPIEINLNINIRQEVLVKLDRQAQELIEKNPGVF